MCRAVRRAPLLGETRSKSFGCWPFRAYNHNVVVTWLVVLTEGWADSIWTGTVLASFLYELMGQSNAYAGYVEAAMGVTNLVVALPVGWLADKGSKSRIIRWGGAIVPLAVGATSFAVVFGVSHRDEQTLCFGIFLGAMCLWGVVQAIVNGPAQVRALENRPGAVCVCLCVCLSLFSLFFPHVCVALACKARVLSP